MNIKDKIEKLRISKKWTKSRLAREAGITPNTVYNWYNTTQATPSRESIENICTVFKISIAEFYADLETDNLSEKEIKLLEVFRKIPDKNKEKAISMLEMLIN